jgi:hypothetical protein
MIKQYLLKSLNDLLDRRHVIVWYDPRGEYEAWAAALDAAALGAGSDGRPALLARHDPGRGFLALRHALEPQWSGEEPPRLLIYVAAAQPIALLERALIEYEVAGAVIQPGGSPPEHDMALAAVTRRALAGRLPAAQIAHLADQLAADPPQLTLNELEGIVERGKTDGVLNHLYPGANTPADIVLAFLADAAGDEELARRAATGQMAALLSETLGAPIGDAEPAALRETAARRVLLTDLALALGAAGPSLIAPADAPAARQAAAELAEQWRSRAPLTQAYVARASEVEAAAGVAVRLHETAASWPELARSQTFAAVESRLQQAVEEALVERTTAEAVALAQTRREGFWARHSTEIRARWSAVHSAGRLLLEAERVLSGLKNKELSARALWDAYVEGRGGEPWCLLDRYQRHFERDFHAVDVDDRQHDALQRLAARARAAYADAAGALSERFVRAYEKAGFDLRGQTPQVDVYQRHVHPVLQVERVAYILVDAFRFEMAHELRERLGDDRPLELTAAVGTPPTITEVGMAALMPGAEKGIILTEDKGKLRVNLAGITLDNRQARVSHFAAAVDVPNVVLKLDQLTPLADKKLLEKIRSARIVLVTATEEIDGRCENNPAGARKELDAVFDELRRALGALIRQGIRTVIITADHGYLFGEALTPAQVIDRPDGHGLVEKRRVWIGRGGQTPAGTLRAPLSAFGIAGEAGQSLELVTPYNLAAFKTPGGNLEYFHGGLSLPELVAPVLVVRAGKQDTAEEVGAFQWKISPGSKTISSQVLTVNIDGATPDLLPPTPPRLTVEVRVGNQSISTLIGANEGYSAQTNDIQPGVDPANPRRILPITAILQLPEPPDAKSASIVLLDATTGGTLAQVANVAITISL